MPSDEPIEGLCGARCRGERAGKFCEQKPINGTGKCKQHGGMSLRGPASPSWKHGRWSKAMGAFHKKYDDARNDPELLDVRRTLAVLDVAVERAAARVNELDTPGFRVRALELWREARDCLVDDPEAASLALGQLGQLLNRGASEDAAFRSLVEAADMMARRTEAAWGIKLKGVHVATRAELVEHASRIIDVVVREAPVEVATKIIECIRAEVFGPMERQQLETMEAPE